MKDADGYDPAVDAHDSYFVALDACRAQLLQKRRADAIELAIRNVLATWKGCWIEDRTPTPAFSAAVAAEFTKLLQEEPPE